MMQDTQVPPLPPTPGLEPEPVEPEPKKPRRLLAIVGAGVLVLAIGGVIGQSLGDGPTAVAADGGLAVTAPEEVESCLDVDEATSHSTAVATYLNQAASASESYDLAGAASALDAAADEVEAAAAATTADPAVADPMFEAAGLFREAAGEIRSVDSMSDLGPIYRATDLMTEANSKIEQSTAAVGRTTVPVC